MHILSEQAQADVRLESGTDKYNNRLKILSYNIQSGLPSESLKDYFTQSWRHLFPTPVRMSNLQQIGELLHQFDLVALQEVDPGSRRSGFVNQVQHLAHLGGFPHWYLQLNRKLGKIAKYSNAVLSRFKPYVAHSHKLPGLIPGRGAIRLFYGDPTEPLVIVIAHLALGPMARRQQLQYIASLIKGYQHVILMGDMNCRLENLLKHDVLKDNQLRPTNILFNTYPSWKPRRNIDHIFVSDSVKIEKVEVLNLPFSDHLPIALEVSLPHTLVKAN